MINRDALRHLAHAIPGLSRYYRAIAALNGARRAAEGELATIRTSMDALRAERDALGRAAEERSAIIRALEAERDSLGARLAARDARMVHLEGLAGADRLIELDFPVRPRIRHGWGRPPHARLEALVAAGEARYALQLDSIVTLAPQLARIETRAAHPEEPSWINDWFPAFDAVALYATLVSRNPRTLVEIGSGTSTKFARRAVRDHGLRTRIVSVDPFPRSEVDAICDEVVRSPLEEAPLSLFQGLTAEDVVFFDGSHRAFQNSDATVFFTEILPELPEGLLFGVHDIFIPDDYPEAWLSRFYSEQYLLACWLLAGDRLKIELPVWWCSRETRLRTRLDAIWGLPALAGAHIDGGAFWCHVAGRR